MLINWGRDHEVEAIVTHDRAVEVGNLLLGRLDRPMRRISPEKYRSLPRKQLRSGRESLRAGLTKELEGFCERNFGSRDIRRLAGLYEPLFKHGSQLKMSYREFVELVGEPREHVLRGAPPHCTICLSPRGLQTEYPEMHLIRDLAYAFNSAVALEDEIDQERKKVLSWSQVKRAEVQRHRAQLVNQAAFHRRVRLLSCFNLLEAYINGVAWDFVDSHQFSSLSKKEKEMLEGGASIINSLVRVPEIVGGKSPRPLSHDAYPLQTFTEVVKPLRDSIVHASPFSAPAKFGGYDKLAKVYELTLATTRECVDLAVDIIGRIHAFIGADGVVPRWMPARRANGTFIERMV
jgi:hypothetical protein